MRDGMRTGFRTTRTVEEDWMKVAAQLQKNRARLEEIAVPMGE